MEQKNVIFCQKGSTLIYSVVVIFIFSLVMLAALAYATIQIRVVRSTQYREQAFQIAEAGVNYYQWRLAHFANDFWDGNASTTPGPYIHDYIDKDTNTKIGEYSLQIIPPGVGSTIATIHSTGYTMANPKIKRTITVRYGIPSLAKYAFLTHNDVWIGDTENISGQMHANGGIHFDGTGNAPIISAKATYTCQTYHGCSPAQTKLGIWGDAPQSTKNYWQYPRPNVDFAGMTSDLANIKSGAQDDGIYLPPSSASGYSLVFNSDATIAIYRVNSLYNTPSARDVNGVMHNENIDYSTNAGARTKLDGNPSIAGVQNFTMPANGLIFIEDNTWVEGTVRGRATVVAAKLPYNSNTAPNIMVQNNLVYAAKDGSNVLGLIAQKNFLISYNAPNILEIDAAIIAQNGSAQIWNFNHIYTSLTIYGAISSFGVWTWSWSSGGVCNSGYCNTYTNYDGNLLFGPPPSYPVSADGYQQISWNSD